MTDLFDTPANGVFTDKQIRDLILTVSARLNSDTLRALADAEEKHQYAAMQLGNSAQVAAINEKSQLVEEAVRKIRGYERNLMTNIVTKMVKS